MALALATPLFFVPKVVFAVPAIVYDGVTYPGDDSDHGGTKIDGTNTDVTSFTLGEDTVNGINNNIIMTGGKLQLYNAYRVAGTINSDVSGENELQFENTTYGNRFDVNGDIGATHSFNLIGMQGVSDIHLNGNDLNATTIDVGGSNLFIEGGTLTGDIIIKKYQGGNGSIRISEGSTINGVVKGEFNGDGDIMVLENETYHGSNGTYLETDIFRLQNNLGTSGHALNAIYIGENKVLSGETHDIYATVIKLNNGSTFSTGSGTIRGSIVGNASGKGILNVDSDFATSSNIGSGGGGSSLNKIHVGGGAAKLTINNNIAANDIVSEGVVDFSANSHTINANFEGYASSTTNANSGHHTINGSLTINPTAVIGSKLYNSGSGTDIGNITSTGIALIGQGDGAGEGAKLSLDLSGLTFSRITAGVSTYDLITGATGSTIYAIQDVDINIGGGYGSNSLGALTFHTSVEGDILKLWFSTNSNLFEVVDNGTITASADITEAAVIVGENATLNMASYDITNANVTLKSGANLTTGTGTSIQGFITGLTSGVGTFTVNGGDGAGDEFISRSDIGYGHSLAEVNVANGKTLQLVNHDNSLSATNLTLGTNASLVAGAGDITTTNITLGSGSILTTGDGAVTGLINGSASGNGTLRIVADKTFAFDTNIGTTYRIAAIDIQNSNSPVTFDVGAIEINATNFKLGSNAVINFNESTINAVSILDSEDGVSFNQILNLTDTTLNLSDKLQLGFASTINIGANSYINGDIIQHYGNRGVYDSGGNGVINISSNFTSNGNFQGSGAINLLNGADLNLATNNNDVSHYNIVLSANSILTVGDGSIDNGTINGDADGRGALMVLGEYTPEEIGNTNSLESITVASGAVMDISPNRYLKANDIIVNGVIKQNDIDSASGHSIEANVEIGATGTFDSDVFANIVTGTLTTVSGSTFKSTLTDDSSASGSVTSSLSTIAFGTKLYLNISSLTLGNIEAGTTTYTLISGGSGGSINEISEANIDIGNGNGSNRIDGLRFFTEVVDNSLVLKFAALSVTPLQIYSYTNPLPDPNTDITEYTEVHLLDSGAILAMGSGNINADVKIAEGAILQIGTGDVNGTINGFDSGQGTLNLTEDFSASGNIGLIHSLSEVNVSTETNFNLGDYKLVANEININGTFQIGGENQTGSISSEGEGSRAYVNLGETGSFEIGYVADNSITAGVNGASAGFGTIRISSDVTLENLLIGNDTRIAELLIDNGAEVSLGRDVSATNVTIEDSELLMLDGTTTTVTDKLFVDGESNSTYFYLGQTEGNGASVVGKVEIQGSDGAYVYVNTNSTIDGDVEFVGDGELYLYGNSTITGGITDQSDSYSYVNIRGNYVEVAEDISGIYNFEVDSLFENGDTRYDEDGDAYGSVFSAGSIDINVRNRIQVSENASLVTSGNLTSNYMPVREGASLTTTGAITTESISLYENASLETSGIISGGIDGDEHIINTDIELQDGSTLTMNSGSSLHASVHSVDETDGEDGAGAGSLIFADRGSSESVSINGNIGIYDESLYKLASIAVGVNVELDNTDGYYIYTDALSLASSSNINNASELHSSTVTVDTNDVTKGIIGAHDNTSLYLNTLSTSSLTLTSGLVTSDVNDGGDGIGNATVKINNASNSSTTITVGQDSLSEGDSAAILSNTGYAGNALSLISKDFYTTVNLTVDNKATGTISSNGVAINLRSIDEDIEHIDASTVTINNAGTITTSDPGEEGLPAIYSKYSTNITNSGTITGGISLGSEYQNSVINTGTINGPISIGNNYSSSIEANGGVINGDISMRNSSQVMTFNNGATLNGNIYGRIMEDDISGNVVINNATFSQDTTSIYATTFTTNANSFLNLTLSSISITPLEIVGAASIASSTTLNLTISGSIASDEHYTVLNATSITGGAIADSYIKINGLSNSYDGKTFSVVIVDNELRLVSTGITAPRTIETPAAGAKDAFESILAISNPEGNLLTIQNLLTGNIQDAEKVEIIKSILPQVDNSSNRNSFNIASSSVNVVTGRVDTLRNGIASGDTIPSKRIWTEAFGNSASQKNTLTSNGYNLNSRGFAIGGDKEIADDEYFGGSVSYANSNIKAKGVSKNTQATTYQINLYGTKNFDQFFLDGVAGFALNNYSSSRSISAINAKASADYSGQAYISKFRAGSVVNLKNHFILVPEFSVTAAHNKVDSYTESGAGNLDLHVKTSSANFLEGRLGFNLSRRYKSSDEVIIPQIKASYGYDFVGSRQSSTSNFVGQSTTFQSQGDKIVRGSLKIGTGIRIYSKENIIVNADYDLEIKNGYIAKALTARFTYGF